MNKNKMYNYLCCVVPIDVVTDDNLPVDECHGDETEPEQYASDDWKAGSRNEDVGEDVEDSSTEVERGQDQHVGSADAENVNEDDREYPDNQVLKAVAVARPAAHDALGILVASLGLIFDNWVQHCRLNVIPRLLVAQCEDDLEEPGHVRKEDQNGYGERDVCHIVDVQRVVGIVHIIIWERSPLIP